MTKADKAKLLKKLYSPKPPKKRVNTRPKKEVLIRYCVYCCARIEPDFEQRCCKMCYHIRQESNKLAIQGKREPIPLMGSTMNFGNF